MGGNILGSFLKRKRVEANMSQIEMARKLGYTSAQYISNFERGVCQPSMKILNQLADSYGLDRAELFDAVMEQQKLIVSQLLFSNKRRGGRRKTAV